MNLWPAQTFDQKAAFPVSTWSSLRLFEGDRNLTKRTTDFIEHPACDHATGFGFFSAFAHCYGTGMRVLLRRLSQSQRGNWSAIGDRCARCPRDQLHRARRSLEGIGQVDSLRVFLQRGYHLLREQAHTRAAIVVADRTLNAQYDEDAGTQHGQDALDLWDQGLGGTNEDLQVLLSPQQRRVQLAADFIVIDSAAFGFLHLLPQFRTADTEPGAGLLLRHYSDGVLGIVAGRHGELRRRKRILDAAVNEAFRKLLRLVLGLREHGRNQVAEVLRTGLIPLLRCLVGIKIPQLAGRAELGAERDVGIAMLGAPLHGFGAEHARNPRRGMGLLIRQCPRIHVTIMKMLALVTPWAGPRPGLHDKVVRLVEHLAVVSRIGVVEKLLRARAAHPSGDQAAA